MSVRSLSTSSLKNNQPRSGNMQPLKFGIEVEYLVIAGGGGGAGSASNGYSMSGGGGGGYLCNVLGENTGQNIAVTAEDRFVLNPGTYRITVGAGGAGGARANYTFGAKGADSQFANLYAFGGGGGLGQTPNGANDTSQGGSAGGWTFGIDGSGRPRRAGTFRQGFGTPATSNANHGGGGAGGTSSASNAGVGLTSSINGTALGRSGGGPGAKTTQPPATSSDGGAIGVVGGSGGSAVDGNSAPANRGGGGGGGAYYAGGNGGSGVVIFRVPSTTSVSFSGGVTHTTTTVGDKTAYVVTATSTTSETVTIG